MGYVFRYILSILIAIITLVSGSGFSTLKMVCLCSGEVTISIFDKKNCEEPKASTDTPTVDHKCCEYSTTFIKINTIVLESLLNTIGANFNFISLPVFFIFSENVFPFNSNIFIKDFVPLLKQDYIKIYLVINNFRI